VSAPGTNYGPVLCRNADISILISWDTHILDISYILLAGYAVYITLTLDGTVFFFNILIFKGIVS
jgi:hypothetical protein